MAPYGAASCCWGEACSPAPAALRVCACGKSYHSHCAMGCVGALFAGMPLADLETETCGQCGAHGAAAAALSEEAVHNALAALTAARKPLPLPPAPSIVPTESELN